MKHRHTRLSLMVALLFGSSLACTAQSANYLFAYFTGNGEDGLHLMYSRDGFKWSVLNGGKSYLTPTIGSQKLMRDPCLLQGPDGIFHLVWATGLHGRDIGINWSEQKAIPVMAESRVSWRNALQQRAEWYSSAEALQIADNVLWYQRDNGGWDKNIDMAAPLAPADRAKILADKDAPHSTIDNGATVTQLHYLARVFNAMQQPQYKDAFLKGLDYLLAAQYANGGWPQYFPLRKGYYTHITYNDNAMIGVMQLLRAMVQKDSVFAFVDETRRAKAERAIAKGLDIILKTQVVVDGKKTVWCAQHDDTTLAPAPARAYEKISLSGSESVGIVRYLMSIEKPTPKISAAINAAMAWFGQAKLTGIKVIERRDESFPRGFDRIVEQDENAPPLWARFYDIHTNRPIFCGRDGIIKSTLAEIEHERRVGYSWYTNAPAELLTKDFPAWQAQQAHKR